MTNISPTRGKIAVTMNDAESVLDNGLVLPPNARDLPQQATVVAIGPWPLTTKTGIEMTQQIEVGDTVLLTDAYAGASVFLDDKSYIVVDVTEVAAVLS